MCSCGELLILKKLKPNTIGTENVAEEEDIISSLPDCLLIHILSFLGDIKQAARTSLLSKRWVNVWTDLSEVDLFGNDFEIAKRKRFVDLVGTILGTCKILDRFAVDFWYDNRFASNVNSWFFLAVSRKVKNISLKFLFNYYELPQIIFSYSLLEILTLSGFVMAPQGIITWGSLKSLSLTLDSITNDLMEKILLGCPALEMLHLGSCRGLDNMIISSSTLTTLEIEQRQSSWKNNVVLDISAPYLRVLSICNKNPRLRFRLTHVPSVVQASFDFHGLRCRDEKNYMKELLENLQSIKKLKLGPQCSMIVSYMYVDGMQLPSFDKLQCLTLNVWRHALSIPAIEGILRSSPNLETLLMRRIWNRFEEIMLDEGKVNFMYYDMDINASHLKTVKITDFTEQDLTAEYMLTLVESLLENTNALKEMIISLKEDPSHNYASSSTSVDSSELAKRLLTFHRASSEAVVVLNL